MVCICECESSDTYAWSVAGTPAVSDCSICTGQNTTCLSTICTNNPQDYTANCESTEPDRSWSATYQVQLGGACSPPPPGVLKACFPPCATDICNCWTDNVIIEEIDGTNSMNVTATIGVMGTDDVVTVWAIFEHLYDTGLAANGTFMVEGQPLEYTFEYYGGNLLIKNDPYWNCGQSALIASSTSIWKLALIIGAVALVVVGVIIFCFRKKFTECCCSSSSKQVVTAASPPPQNSAPYTILPSERRVN